MFKFSGRKDKSNGSVPLHNQKFFYDRVASFGFIAALTVVLFGWFDLPAINSFKDITLFGNWEETLNFGRPGYVTGTSQLVAFISSIAYVGVWAWYISSILYFARDYFSILRTMVQTTQEAIRSATDATGTFIGDELTGFQRLYNWIFGYRFKMWTQRTKKKNIERKAKMDQKLAVLEAELAQAEAIANGDVVIDEDKEVDLEEKPQSLFDE